MPGITKISEALARVRELLDSPEKWTKRTHARDAKGNSCGIETGVSWCLEGAVLHVFGIEYGKVIPTLGSSYVPTLYFLNRFIGDEVGRSDVGTAYWNDKPSTTYEDVVLMLKKAQIAAELEGK